MLFPDETYEDYKKRIKTTTNLKPKTTQTPNEEFRTTSLQHSVTDGKKRNYSVTKSLRTQDSSGRESATSTSNSSSGYKLTRDFFDNIPESRQTEEKKTAANTTTTCHKQQELPLKTLAAKDEEATKQPTNGHTNHNDTVNEDLSTNPIFLRTCEALIRQIFQYYKAVSSNSTSPASSTQPSQTKSIPKKKSHVDSYEKSSTKSSSKCIQNSAQNYPDLQVDSTPNTTSSEEVQRFTKRSAIYTLPKRRLENSDHIAAIVKDGLKELSEYRTTLFIYIVYFNNFIYVYPKKPSYVQV
ncbi:hypothetical protein CVS40_10536 [Lucilia cuprina]|nr:hypothetical protein CVS40_10536 [Lucilia cuprina]